MAWDGPCLAVHLSPTPALTGRAIPAHCTWNLHLLLGRHCSLPPLLGHGWCHSQKVHGWHLDPGKQVGSQARGNQKFV